MLDKLYKENIKSTMNWNTTQFDLFLSLWKELNNNKTKEDKKSFLGTEGYFELLLSLFFITIQIDVMESYKEKKSILLSLLCFYTVCEDFLLQQTERSLETIVSFLNKLVELRLISIPCAKYTSLLLYSFSGDSVSVEGLLERDRELLHDLLLSVDPVVVDRKHAMFYYDNPQESMFAVKKPYPKPNDFFDAMFKASRQIKSKTLRGFYVDRLYRLMDTQAKKSIFPF